ncbi:MAG: hypothetical protein ACYCZX_17315 [Rhodospirillaceae bacterium]
MRLFLISALGILILSAAGAADAASDKQSYCINQNAEFYPYEDGQACRKGYQVAGGNCHLKDGRMVAVTKADCARLEGDVALPAPAARLTGETETNAKPKAKPLTVLNPKP